MRLKIISLFLSLFLLPSCLFAQSVSDCPLQIVDLIDLALANNPETRLTWWNAKRAAAALDSARSAYSPIIGINAHLTNGRDFRFVNGPDVDYTITGVDLTLNLLLYDFGERDAQVQVAKNALVAANWQTDWVLQKVLVDVFENAYTILNLQETLQAARISSDDAVKMLETAVELNRAGLTPVTDVHTSRAQVSQAKMEVVQHQSHLEIQYAKLASSLGLMADTPLKLATISDLPTLSATSLSKLIDLALKQRADLMAKHARVKEARAQHLKTQLSYRPKISVYARGGANRAVEDKANAAQYQVKLNLDIPLYDGFNHVYQNRMAFADLRTSIEELAQLELNIAFEVLSYSKNLQAAQAMLPLAESNLNSAKQAYEGVLETYGSGKIDIAVVSNALRQLAAARMRYSDVRTKLLVAAANLAFSTGTLLPYVETSCEKSF